MVAVVIRVATDADWQEVLAKITAFNDLYFGIPVNTDKLFGWFDQHLSHGVILLSPEGILSALQVSDPVRNWTAMVETSWYDPGVNGARLVLRLREHAEECMCDEVRMTTLNTTPAGVITLLNRMGFEEIERSHRLTL